MWYDVSSFVFFKFHLGYNLQPHGHITKSCRHHLWYDVSSFVFLKTIFCSQEQGETRKRGRMHLVKSLLLFRETQRTQKSLNSDNMKSFQRTPIQKLFSRTVLKNRNPTGPKGFFVISMITTSTSDQCRFLKDTNRVHQGTTQ